MARLTSCASAYSRVTPREAHICAEFDQLAVLVALLGAGSVECPDLPSATHHTRDRSRTHSKALAGVHSEVS